MTTIESEAFAAPSGSAAGSRSRDRWNVWAWVGLVASAAILWYRWRNSASGVPIDTDYLFSTLALLHATAPIQTLWWINSWAELLVPIAYVGALSARSVVAVRLAAAATAQVTLFVVYRSFQRYVEPPWLEWWFYGAILVLAVSSAVVLRVGRVGGSGGGPSSAGLPFVGARSTAVISVLCGAVLLFLPAILFGEVVRSRSDEDDSTSRLLARVGTVLGALGLAIAVGYLIATTQKTD